MARRPGELFCLYFLGEGGIVKAFYLIFSKCSFLGDIITGLTLIVPVLVFILLFCFQEIGLPKKKKWSLKLRYPTPNEKPSKKKNWYTLWTGYLFLFKITRHSFFGSAIVLFLVSFSFARKKKEMKLHLLPTALLAFILAFLSFTEICHLAPTDSTLSLVAKLALQHVKTVSHCESLHGGLLDVVCQYGRRLKFIDNAFGCSVQVFIFHFYFSFVWNKTTQTLIRTFTTIYHTQRHSIVVVCFVFEFRTSVGFWDAAKVYR